MSDKTPVDEVETEANGDKIGDGESDVGKPRRRGREIVFVFVILILAFSLPEILLRIIGFRFEPVPILVDTTWGPKQLTAMDKSMGGGVFERDDTLFWRLKPGARLDIRQVNDLGLLNGPVEIPKPSGTYRILCLGDSCTVMGPVSYAQSLQNRLDIVERPERRFEVVNAGCFSYTSLQGYRQFRERLEGIQPDLVTVYYGWNDHYLTAAYPDKLLTSRNTPMPAPIRFLRRFRLYQLIQRSVNTAQTKKLARQREGKRLVRVAPEDYRANIRAIVDLARKRGAHVVLLTAPSNHRPGNVPAFFLENEYAESEEALVARHRRYNAIVREVAAEKKAELLDLEKVFDGEDKDRLFVADGVHPNGHGRRLVARQIQEKIGEMGILSPDELRRIVANPGYKSYDPNILRSRVEIQDGPLRIAAGQSLNLRVEVTNTGDTLWLARPEPLLGQVRMGVIVYNRQGKRLFERERGSLPHDVSPGQTVEVRWSIRAIAQPGEYVLEVDPVAENVTWFNAMGDERSTAALTVEPAAGGGGSGL